MNKRLLCLTFAFFAGMGVVRAAQKGVDITTLYARLNDFKTSDVAAAQILSLASDNQAAREYIVDRLPGMIEKSTTTSDLVWRNAVRLAGQLKAMNTVPNLLKVFRRQPTAPGMFLFQDAAINDGDPVGQSLSEFGDAVVPSLAELLQRGDKNVRFRTARVLWMIDTSASRKVLHEGLRGETDPAFRVFSRSKSQKADTPLQ